MSTGRRRLGGSFFFFSIRRRHTRLVSDWSSDVCSSDLSPTLMSTRLAIVFGMMRVINLAHGEFLMLGGYAAIVRSEERRVGKECSSRRSLRQYKKNARGPQSAGTGDARSPPLDQDS